MEPAWKRPSLGIARRPGFMRMDWVESTWFDPVQVRTNQSVTGTSWAGWTVPALIVPWIPDVRRSVSAALFSAETAGMDRRVSAAVTTRARRMMARRIDDSLGRPATRGWEEIVR